ncbi:MAG: glycosyltransferase family 2 protein [Pseudomonadota bacterium]|nr:glycosyltransferase family 2 protein [Pseudomonadota bacterium]
MPDEATTPLVTVVMVTYNSESYVGSAISSVLAQDFSDFELLVCDDCSSDRTWPLIGEFSDRRIRARRNPSNSGEYANRNQAVALASGKYLMFLDGDDYLYPHGLGVMVRMMESFPSAAFASAQPPSAKFVYPVELTPQQFFSCQFLGPNVMGRDFTQLIFRTDRIRDVGGFDPRFRSGDTHIQLRLALKANCVLIGDGLAWWRRYPGQASESLVRDRWGLAEYVCYGQEALAHSDCPLSAQERRLAKSNLCRMLLRNVARYAREGRVVHALGLLRRGCVSVRDWRFLFAKDRMPYLQETTGKNPLTSEIQELQGISRHRSRQAIASDARRTAGK